MWDMILQQSPRIYAGLWRRHIAIYTVYHNMAWACLDNTLRPYCPGFTMFYNMAHPLNAVSKKCCPVLYPNHLNNFGQVNENEKNTQTNKQNNDGNSSLVFTWWFRVWLIGCLGGVPIGTALTGGEPIIGDVDRGGGTLSDKSGPSSFLAWRDLFGRPTSLIIDMSGLSCRGGRQ